MDPLTIVMSFLSLFGSGMNIFGNMIRDQQQHTHDKETAKDQFEYDTDLSDRQHEHNMDLWHRTNEYNHPSQQMQRYEEAGLNPYLAHSGNIAATQPQSTQQAGMQATNKRATSTGDIISNMFKDLLGIPKEVETRRQKKEMHNIQLKKKDIEIQLAQTQLKYAEDLAKGKIKAYSDESILKALRGLEIQNRDARAAERHPYDIKILGHTARGKHLDNIAKRNYNSLHDLRRSLLGKRIRGLDDKHSMDDFLLREIMPKKAELLQYGLDYQEEYKKWYPSIFKMKDSLMDRNLEYITQDVKEFMETIEYRNRMRQMLMSDKILGNVGKIFGLPAKLIGR